jgi:hypothetical protein
MNNFNFNNVLSQRATDLFPAGSIQNTNPQPQNTNPNQNLNQNPNTSQTHVQEEPVNNIPPTTVTNVPSSTEVASQPIESPNPVQPEENKPAEEPKQDLPKPKLDTKHLKTMVFQMKDQLDSMIRILNGEEVQSNQDENPDETILETGERIIEGVFNGEKMVGPDGSEYAIPPNYASKSKLVEGDMMKLTITNKGSFIYKQIGPIDRRRIVGELIFNPSQDQWSVLAESKPYKILNASVTFYKGKPGDEVILLVPKNSESSWGAVDNIVKK